MKIKYLGHSCFKITGKSDASSNVTVVTDPFDSKMVGLSLPQQEADIVTVSHHHTDHDFTEKVKPKGENLFIADTPGEYEIQGLRIYGVKSYHDDKGGKERGSNTIFIYDFEEARVAHLGDLGHPLNSDQIEELENVEILIVPVGGFYTIDAKAAWDVIDDIEPLIVIPMHYKTDKHAKGFDNVSGVEEFLSKPGININNQEELSVKSKADLPTALAIVNLSF